MASKIVERQAKPRRFVNPLKVTCLVINTLVINRIDEKLMLTAPTICLPPCAALLARM
jgi:hypothetical protein